MLFLTMLLDAKPVFDDRISLGTILQLLFYAGTAIALFSRRFNRQDSDSKTVTKLSDLQEKAGETQAKLAQTQSTQQALIERIESNQAESRKDHKEQMEKLEREHGGRIKTLEEVVFVNPAKNRGRRQDG